MGTSTTFAPPAAAAPSTSGRGPENFIDLTAGNSTVGYKVDPRKWEASLVRTLGAISEKLGACTVTDVAQMRELHGLASSIDARHRTNLKGNEVCVSFREMLTKLVQISERFYLDALAKTGGVVNRKAGEGSSPMPTLEQARGIVTALQAVDLSAVAKHFSDVHNMSRKDGQVFVTPSSVK